LKSENKKLPFCFQVLVCGYPSTFGIYKTTTPELLSKSHIHCHDRTNTEKQKPTLQEAKTIGKVTTATRRTRSSIEKYQRLDGLLWQ
jgi:hypothetical protein